MCAEFVESPRATCGYGSEIAGWSVVEIDAEIDRLQQNSARIERHLRLSRKVAAVRHYASWSFVCCVGADNSVC